MTLIIAAIAKKGLWVSADRRLTYTGGRTKDDARKIMALDATDGHALLGYSGLGATAAGNEPSEWMSRVLRGRNLPLERSLGTITDAAREHLRPHLETFPRSMIRAHSIVIPAFICGRPKMFSIDLELLRGAAEYRYRFVNWTRQRSPAHPAIPHRIGIAGSGSFHLAGRRDWRRPLRRLLNAFDRDRITAETVAQQLAAINHEVSRHDPMVSSECIVAWRASIGGGAHNLYCDGKPKLTAEGLMIPSIANGTDMTAFVRAIMPHMMRHMESSRRGEALAIDANAMNADLARLPETPDERLT